MAKVSPVEASTAYLAHLRDAWNHAIAGKIAADRLETQDVLLTVPASFDAVARELTVEAARAAGLENVTLLEEPQAAFYAWLAAQGDQWRKRVKVGDLLLVCDVGGGTTDFTLIAVTDQDGDLALTRLAVGEHILLGGDNMDLALAHAVAATLPNGMDGLDPAQRVALGHACRAAKETLFAAPSKASAPVAVLGRGSKVIGGSIKAELTRETLNAVLLDGFFPPASRPTSPSRGRRVGLTEIGLPYAADPAITRHLARFLGRQAGSLHSGGSSVDALGRPLQRRRLQGGRAAEAGRRRPLGLGAAARSRAWRRPTSTSPSPSAPPITAWSARARGSGSGAACRGPITSASRPRARPSRASSRRSRPSAWSRWGWRRGPRPTSPAPSSAWSSASPPSSASSARPPAATTRPGVILDRWSPEELQELDPLETALVTEDGADRGGHRPGPAPRPRHRGRHPGTLVPEHPRRSPLEAGIQRPRGHDD